MATLVRGDDLGLREDLTNTVNALLITRHGDELGWVPDLLLDCVMWEAWATSGDCTT
ncbi:hypothetical protein [Nonomuraea guangzhouensis]|uniref:PRC-barrel domain containing protein n=1 Tax=Nonomuraea guangzhouensis TaxID=1291555 RepID=A0ABW4GBM3_9ACTN|nr:hypothetical protein [Nonomuraea guangzhouensis]